MTVLLDGNVLVALSVVDHVHHDAARRWFSTSSDDDSFATTPITQGTLLRFLVRHGLSAADALTVLHDNTTHDRHVFWPDDRGYDSTALRGVIGHRQITDGYLAALARAHDGALATFDQGLAIAHADVVHLVSAEAPGEG